GGRLEGVGAIAAELRRNAGPQSARGPHDVEGCAREVPARLRLRALAAQDVASRVDLRHHFLDLRRYPGGGDLLALFVGLGGHGHSVHGCSSSQGGTEGAIYTQLVCRGNLSREHSNDWATPP